MATIVVHGNRCRAVFIEPDEDGDYAWVADCGYLSAKDRGYQPIGDALQGAAGHVDDSCRKGK